MKDMEFNLSGAGLRIAIIALLAAFIYAIIAIQLWNVQIRSGEEHREKVSKQYARKIRMPAVRGRIFSSDMKLLADNRPSYNVQFVAAGERYGIIYFGSQAAVRFPAGSKCTARVGDKVTAGVTEIGQWTAK